MLKVGVLAGGGGTNLQAIIDAVENGVITNAQISFVLSNNPDAYALERARNHGIARVVVDKKAYEDSAAFDEALCNAIRSMKPDLIVLAGLMIMIPPALVREYEHKIINIHPSLIPSFCGKGYYGLRVHEAALKKGVKVTGATVHFVDEIYDNGPILLQKAVAIENGDTPEILQRRVMEQAEWIILPKAIDLIANGKVRFEDNKAIVTE